MPPKRKSTRKKTSTPALGTPPAPPAPTGPAPVPATVPGAATLSVAQFQALMNSINASNSNRGSIQVKSTAPIWKDIKDDAGNVIIKKDEVSHFFTKVLKLSNLQVNFLLTKGIDEPADFGELDKDGIDAVFTNGKKVQPFKGRTQTLIKQLCDWVQYLRNTNQTLIPEYLDATMMENHAIALKLLTDSKDVKKSTGWTTKAYQ